jgi:hypothetical protein
LTRCKAGPSKVEDISVIYYRSPVPANRQTALNGLFEPLWNCDHLEYVQIDVPETLSIEERAAFYEGTGAFRDMVVTHLFQVLGFVAMEPPTMLSAKALRNERQKVFDSMRPIDTKHVVRGQYDGYLREPGVDKTRKPKRSWRFAQKSRTSGGPASRSVCAPASRSGVAAKS